MQAAHQGPAVLGLAMISMGEELGASMSLRMLEHLLRYGEPSVRCAASCHPHTTAAWVRLHECMQL